MNKIAILTSGGDAQGMNAAVYATVRYAIKNGMEVFGIYKGYKGLIEGNVKQFSNKDVEDIMHKGGTILGTARCLEMKTPEGQQKAVETLRKYDIDGLVVIGGDGSFKGAQVLSTKYGIKTIGIPGTIDNDLAYTDFTLGFDTATTVAVNTIKQLRDTMSCNDRSCVVEVMGRNCGDVAMYAAVATGAEGVIIPEIGYDLDKVAKIIEDNKKIGKYDNIIVVAEGIGTAYDIRMDIKNRFPDINIRSMTVGHIQRGGDATLRDVMMGIRMGVRAVECIQKGYTDRVVGIVNEQIIDMDLDEALAKTKVFDNKLFALTEDLVKY